MNSQHPFFFMILVTLLTQECFSLCSQGNKLATDGTCQPQDVITMTVLPTPNNFVYTLIFEGGQVPFSSMSDFSNTADIAFRSSVTTFSTTSQTFQAVELISDLTIIQFAVDIAEIPYDTTMTVSFLDFSKDQSRPSYIKEPVSIKLLPITQLSPTTSQFIDTFNQIDYVLEVVWLGATLINPYWIFYADCKLYRETLDLLKRVNIQYDPTLISFYKSNSKKIAGLKVPNIFGIFMLDNDFSFGWDKTPTNRVSYGAVNSNRIPDMKVIASLQVHEYTSFPLFFDNYGTELTIFLSCLIIALIGSLICRLVRVDENDNLFWRCILKVKNVLWNFILINIVGSCQSLLFYTAVQIQAFFSEKTWHNQLSLYVGGVVCLFTCVIVFAYLIWLSNSRTDDFYREGILNPDSRTISSTKKINEFFGPVLDFYKAEKRYQVVAILYPLPRALLFSAIVLFLNISPIGQGAALFVVTLLFMVPLIIFRPFVRRTYMIFKIVCEFLLFLALLFVFILSAFDNTGSYDADQREKLGFVLMAIWISIPSVTILFSIWGYIDYYRQIRAQRKTVVPIVPVMARKSKISISIADENRILFSPKAENAKILSVGETPKDDKKLENAKLNKFGYGVVSNVSETNKEKDISILTAEPTTKREAAQTSRTNLSETDNNLAADKSSFMLPSKTRRGDISEILEAHSNDETKFANQPATLIRQSTGVKVFGRLQRKVSPHDSRPNLTNESFQSDQDSGALNTNSTEQRSPLMVSKTGTTRSLFGKLNNDPKFGGK